MYSKYKVLSTKVCDFGQTESFGDSNLVVTNKCVKAVFQLVTLCYTAINHLCCSSYVYKMIIF